MTMTDPSTSQDVLDAERVYAVGDEVAEGSYAKEMDPDQWCSAPCGQGFICSIKAGHLGPQHVAVGGTRVQAVIDRDTSGDPIVEQPTRQVLVERLAIAERELDRVRRERGAADDRVTQRDNEIISLQSIRDSLIADRNRVAEMHEAFRRQVVEVAMRKARQHDWCSVVRQALEEMGLTVTTRYRVPLNTVTITSGNWTATRDDVYVTIESSSPEQAWRDVDNLDDEAKAQLVDDAGVTFPGGFEFIALDAATSGIEEVDE